MEESSIVSAVLISPRREVREAVREHLSRRTDVRVDVELTHAVTLADAGYIEDLKVLQPGIVFLDLDADRKTALELAQILSDRATSAGPGAGKVFGIGSTTSPELLMQAMRAGVSEVFPLPLDHAALDEALDRAARRISVPVTRPSTGQILAFFSSKGGSGATMLATNTAVALQRGGRRVVLVDLDLEMGDVALFLGLKPKYNILDLSKNLHRMDENLLASFLVEHPSGIHLLAAPANPERSETLTPEQIRQIFQFLRAKYDCVVVDTSNAFYDYTLSAFDQADRICLVANVDLPSLRNTQRCFHILDRLGYARESIKLLVNRYQAKGPIKLPDIEATLNFPIFHVLSNDYATVIHGINTGEPFSTGSDAPLAREISALGDALAADTHLSRTRETAAGAVASGAAAPRGLGRLFSRLTKGAAEQPAKAPERTAARNPAPEAGVHAHAR
ncbi:MAG: CpaE family protein [Gemmatimonadota bacterium]